MAKDKAYKTGYLIKDSINMMLVTCLRVLKMKTEDISQEQETIENF